ncbi:hypothetical protein CTEN210_03799 [Chaetoceros tenuissimus]|uniref:Uncharacterized protein n=1 Tax=Chaetoceros tenuissimus TaxID=426638 RepID=A0AAD3CM84_9STRA|nr:hypothetical protein CTEN210_03799 [Chaetoceros tenuissimus]
MSAVSSCKRLLPPITVFGALASTTIAFRSLENRDISDSELKNNISALQRLNAQKSTSSNKHANLKDAQTSILAQNLHNLETIGVTWIPKVLSTEQTTQWKQTIAKQIQKQDETCIIPSGGAMGRIHCRLHKQHPRHIRNKEPPTDVNILHDKLASIANIPISSSYNITLNNIAKEYFESYGISEHEYELAQLQLLKAEPKSTHQEWHRDNVNPSLTVIIALTNVGINGPTELFLRSHKSNMDKKNDDVEYISQNILLGTIDQGDAIVYDSRIIHRGRGYGYSSDDLKSFQDRPVLVIRWDAKATPAPGTGLVGTQIAKLEGNLLGVAYTVMDWFNRE